MKLIKRVSKLLLFMGSCMLVGLIMNVQLGVDRIDGAIFFGLIAIFSFLITINKRLDSDE